MAKKDELKQQILALTKEYYQEVHGQKKPFEPGKTFVNYGGRYFDDQELINSKLVWQLGWVSSIVL